VNYSLWYNAPRLLSDGGLDRSGTICVFGVKDVARATSFTPIQAFNRQQSGGIIPQAVIHSLALLKMDKELPETCRGNLKINKLLLLHLVGPLLYLYR